MGYKDTDEFEENSLPKRTEGKYKKIEKYEPYELTHCVVFEMAIRNEEVKNLIQNISSIKMLQDKVREIIFPSIETLFEDKDSNISESTLQKYKEYEQKYQDLLGLLKEKYYIHYNQNAIYIPEIENPFKDKDFTGMSKEQMVEECQDAVGAPMTKHISGGIGKFLHGEEYTHYKSDNNLYEGFVTARGIESRCKTFNISNINTHFQRKVYDINQINVTLNMSLPEDELVEYIRHIKETLSNPYSKELKSSNKLLGKNIKNAEKTANYPKKPTAKKLADIFFTYDYVTARLNEDEESIKLMEEEYNEMKESIKKSTNYTSKEKNIQINELKKEYKENQTKMKVEKIFKDFDNPIKNISFKSSTASNYYYTLKPYIEDCRYPEFLTGESVIEDEE